MAQQIQLRRDTAANWTSVNPVLAEGEIGLELDTMAYKIGDGSTAWASLDYRELAPEITTLLFSDVADPSAPASGYLNMYAKSYAGRMLPKVIGPSGLDTPLQPAIFGNGIQIASPAASTAFSYFGMAALTAVGTVSHPALVSTDLRQQTRRGIVTSAATANSASELRSGTTQCWRGDTAGLGGFFCLTRFAVSSTTTNQRCAVGLFSTTAAISTSQQPSALTSCIFAGWDDTDTNLQIMSNDASGTCTKVNLGASFPANDPTAVYEVIFFAAPNATTCQYRVKNLTTGSVTTGTIADADLPPTTTFLAWHGYVNNGGTAAAVVFELIRFYLETDY